MIDVDDHFHLFLQRRMRERERHRRAGRRIGIACIVLALTILTSLAVHYMADIGAARESTEIDIAK